MRAHSHTQIHTKILANEKQDIYIHTRLDCYLKKKKTKNDTILNEI